MAINTEQPDGRRRDQPVMFELWIKRALKEQWGPVCREQVPAELLALLDESATTH